MQIWENSHLCCWCRTGSLQVFSSLTKSDLKYGPDGSKFSQVLLEIILRAEPVQINWASAVIGLIMATNVCCSAYYYMTPEVQQQFNENPWVQLLYESLLQQWKEEKPTPKFRYPWWRSWCNRSPTFESAKQSVQQFRTGSLRLQDESSKCVGFSYIGQLLHQLKSTYCRLRTRQSEHGVDERIEKIKSPFRINMSLLEIPIVFVQSGFLEIFSSRTEKTRITSLEMLRNVGTCYGDACNSFAVNYYLLKSPTLVWKIFMWRS